MQRPKKRKLVNVEKEVEHCETQVLSLPGRRNAQGPGAMKDTIGKEKNAMEHAAAKKETMRGAWGGGAVRS